MIQLALRSSTHADVPLAVTRSARIEGRATAVIISSRPARNTPVPNTARSTGLDRGSMAGKCSGGGDSGPSSRQPGSPLQGVARTPCYRGPMDKPGPAELSQLVKAGTASIGRANRAASAVLSVVGELNAAQATFLRSPSIRHQVEQRLAASYEAQVEPLEMASGDLERDLATLEPQHRRIVELIGDRTRRRADLGRLSARHHQAECRLGPRDRGARCAPGRARVARQAPLVLGAGDGSPRHRR